MIIRLGRLQWDGHLNRMIDGDVPRLRLEENAYTSSYGDLVVPGGRKMLAARF